MTRVVAAGICLLTSVAFAGPPPESSPTPVSVYPPIQVEPPVASPPVLFEGTTVPVCPTVCDAPCPNTVRPGLLSRRTAEPKTICCDSAPQLDAVLTRVVPVTPCVPPVCNECVSTCAEKPTITERIRGRMARSPRTSTCNAEVAVTTETPCNKTSACPTASDVGCWSKVKAWLTYRTCRGNSIPCLTPNPYQPSLFAYVPCKNEANSCGWGAGSCSTGCNAGLAAGPRCRSVGGVGLFDRIRGAIGLGGRGECASCSRCTGDGSHRVSEIGSHSHLVRDCSGAAELAGTQLVPGFRFAGAEQIRLYGSNPALPTSNPHWPVAEPEKAVVEKPKSDVPKPMTGKPVDPKKPGGNPTSATMPNSTVQSGLSVNRPFTKQ